MCCGRGVKSSYLTCWVGVPQGSILRPLLFPLYIHDMQLACKNTHLQMYTESAVIIRKTTVEAAHIFTHIHEWLKKLCDIESACIFLKKQRAFHLPGWRGAWRYRGVTLDSTLNFKSHSKEITKYIKSILYNFKSNSPFLTAACKDLLTHWIRFY